MISRNTVILLLIRIGNAGAQAILIGAMARSFPIEQFGTFLYTLTTIALLQALLEGGFPTLILRTTSFSSASGLRLLRIGSLYCTVLLCGFFVLIHVVGGGLRSLPILTDCLPPLLLYVALRSASSFSTNLFYGLERPSLEARCVAIESAALISCAIAVLLFALEPKSTAYLMAGAAAVGLVSRRLTRPDVGERNSDSTDKQLGSIAFEATPYLLFSLVVVALTRADAILVGDLLGESELAYYQGAFRLLLFLLFIPESLAIALFPTLVRRTLAPDTPIRLAWKLLLSFAILGMVVAGFAFFIAPSLVYYVLGVSFTPSVLLLRVLLLSLIPRSIAVLLGNLLTAGGHQGRRTAGITFTTLLAVPTVYWLAESYGAIGAAFSRLCIDLYLALFYAVLLLTTSHRKSERTSDAALTEA